MRVLAMSDDNAPVTRRELKAAVALVIDFALEMGFLIAAGGDEPRTSEREEKMQASLKRLADLGYIDDRDVG